MSGAKLSLQSLLSINQTKLLSLIVAWSSSDFISCFNVQSSIGHLRELNCEKVYSVKNPFDFMGNISLERKINFLEKKRGFMSSKVASKFCPGADF